MVRTLKPDGRIYICPFNDLDPTIEGTLGKEPLEWLWENQWKIKFNYLEAILITRNSEDVIVDWMDSKIDKDKQEFFKRLRNRKFTR